MLDKSALQQLKELKKQIHDATPRDKGTVKGTRKRFGFVIADADGQQYLLPQTEMERVLPGDQIQFVLEPGKDKNDKPVARIEKLLTSTFSTFIGQVKEKNKQMYVLPDHPELSRWVFIPPKYRKSLRDGDLVAAKVCQHPYKNEGRVQAEIVAMIGQPDDPFIEHRYAVIKEGIIEKIWQPDELEAIRHLAEKTLQEAVNSREDLRTSLFFTIDGANTQDLDDALHVTITDNGWQLQVAIADVAAFVEPSSPLDKQAEAQASSVYLPGQKLPMLPDILSSNLCSLRPNEDRLVMVCTLDIAGDGSINNTRYSNAIINSKAKLSYEEVADYLEQGAGSLSDELQNQLRTLNELAKTRQQWRQQHALLMDEYPDYRYTLDERGKITAIERHERNDAQRLVEECMLACNEATASYLNEQCESGLYLGHNGFKVEQLPGVEKLLDACLPNVDKTGINTLAGYKTLQKTIEATASELPLRDILRKKLARSEWTTAKAPHFGLGLEAYTTFTSPIRKYSDLLVHRIIKAKLADNSCKGPDLKQVEHLNTATQAVRTAQRDCEQSLKCQYLQAFVGQVFEGEISMINHKVIGVYLEPFDLHGHIEVRSLNCPFTFKQDSLQLLSEHHNFMLKQTIRVVIEQVDVNQRQVKLKLAEDNAESGNE